MKKQILIGLISIISISTINAQVYDTGDKVGIGTNTPSRKLEVNGVIRLPDNNQVEWGGINNYIYGNNVGNYICLTTNAIERIRIDNGGNVGIGTTSPNNAKLQIQGNGTYDAVLRLLNNGSNGGDWSLISSNDSWTAGPGNLLFASGDPSSANTKFAITKLGNVGIGTTSPAYKLDVCGTIRAKEVKVDLLGGCDFVFRSDYKLMNLKELGIFVKTNQHLPEIASEKEMIENGVNMKEFQMKLLQKIEELTLYTIEQNKKVEQQNAKIQALEEKIEKLESASK